MGLRFPEAIYRDSGNEKAALNPGRLFDEGGRKTQMHDFIMHNYLGPGRLAFRLAPDGVPGFRPIFSIP
jgi:hypothetical protein